jgi:hypothetical protein
MMRRNFLDHGGIFFTSSSIPCSPSFSLSFAPLYDAPTTRGACSNSLIADQPTYVVDRDVSCLLQHAAAAAVAADKQVVLCSPSIKEAIRPARFFPPLPDRSTSSSRQQQQQVLSNKTISHWPRHTSSTVAAEDTARFRIANNLITLIKNNLQVYVALIMMHMLVVLRLPVVMWWFGRPLTATVAITVP